jgi:hypothetical protein
MYTIYKYYGWLTMGRPFKYQVCRWQHKGSRSILLNIYLWNIIFSLKWKFTYYLLAISFVIFVQLKTGLESIHVLIGSRFFYYTTVRSRYICLSEFYLFYLSKKNQGDKIRDLSYINLEKNDRFKYFYTKID